MLLSGIEIEVTRNKFVRRFLCGALVPLIALTLVRIWITWRNDAYLDHVTGAWMALAADLSAGIFYRPLFGEIGYGATRYFPLHFVLQAALTKEGIEPRFAGHLIELASTVTLLGGMYLFLRSLGAEHWLAATAPLLILATGPGQLALLTIRGDILATALNILGITFCLRETWPSWHGVAAAALFTLAFSTKETTVFGMVAVVLVLLFSRRFDTAMRLSIMTIVGYMLVLVIMYVASQGRVVEVMRVAGMAGASWKNLLTGPVRIALTAFEDPVANTSIIILGLAAFIAAGFDSRCLLPRALLLTTLAVTSLIMGTPGTAYNHLLDLYVACIVMFVVWASRQEKRFETFNIGALAIAAVLVLPSLVQLIRHHDSVSLLQGESAHPANYRAFAQTLSSRGSATLRSGGTDSLHRGSRIVSSSSEKGSLCNRASTAAIAGAVLQCCGPLV